MEGVGEDGEQNTGKSDVGEDVEKEDPDWERLRLERKRGGGEWVERGRADRCTRFSESTEFSFFLLAPSLLRVRSTLVVELHRRRRATRRCGASGV